MKLNIMLHLVSGYVRIITKSPIVTLAIISMITFFLTVQTARFDEQISSDLDIYLPKGAEESRIIKKIAQHWATDVEIIFIETDNAYYPETNKDNITDKKILDEISYIEGDEFWKGGLNPNRKDRGKVDGIAYSLSISILIKEINSSAPRMANTLEAYMEDEIAERLGVEDVNISSGDDGMMEGLGYYAIPEDQEQIDYIVDQIPSNVLESLVADSNDDGIWDTAYIMFGVVDEVDDEAFYDKVENVLNNRPNKNTRMVQTGIIPIMLDVTEEAMDQIMATMPFALIFTIGVIVFFHRSFKILLIAGLPLLFTLIWTFGIIVLMDVMVSPIIVAAIPMLIGLGVDYGLHLANRIAEFQREEHEEVNVAIKDSFMTTGKAIFLSAMTTIIGFSALFLSSLQPIVMMGVTLVVGISSAFFLTMTMIPCLVILTKYRKKEFSGWRTFSKYPVKFRWPVVLIVVMVTLASLGQLSMMTETSTDRPKERDTGLESITVIRKFSDYWVSGQSAMLLMEGDRPGVLNDTPILDGIDHLQAGINDIDKVSSMCIVDLFKSVSLNISWQTTTAVIDESQLPPYLKDIWKYVRNFTGEQTENYYWRVTYWDFIHWEAHNSDTRKESIEIFYKSLTDEMRAMLMTEDYSMTLMIVNFPYLGIGETERIIDDINSVVAERGDLQGGRSSKASGITALMLVANRAIIESQYWTVILSLFFVFIALSVIFFSIRLASITMVPIFLVLAWQPITMAGVSEFTGGATLNMMTAMIGSIIIGTGIDYAVHISVRIKEEGETIQGVMRATEHTGQTIAEATLTTVAGLSGGLLVTWFRGFFFIIISLLLYAMFAGLVVLPAVYAISIKFMEKRYRGYLKDEEVYEAELVE